MQELDVWLLGVKAGRLKKSDNEEFIFQYDKSYIENKGLPLSYPLALRSEAYIGQTVKNFFENLIPEGSLYTGMCHISHLDTQDVIGFLGKWGRECAGALAFAAPGENLRETGDKVPLHVRSFFKNDYVPLAISGECMTFHKAPPAVRMSLGGGQDKLPVIYENGQLFVPTGGQPSTHILKPNLKEFPHSARNEALCLDLARRIGLPAARCEVVPVNRGAFVAVERYDRRNGKRLHQIDFCQVLDIGRAEKYQKEKNHENYSGIESLIKTCKKLKIEAPNKETVNEYFWKAMLYAWFIKNTDAHAKNYSVIFYPENDNRFKAKLAPLYDMNSMYFYPYADGNMAMKYNEKFRHDKISAEDLVCTATALAIEEKAALNDIINMGNKIINTIPCLVDEHRKKYKDAPIYHKLKKAIIWHTKKILNSFNIHNSLSPLLDNKDEKDLQNNNQYINQAKKIISDNINVINNFNDLCDNSEIINSLCLDTDDGRMTIDPNSNKDEKRRKNLQFICESSKKYTNEELVNLVANILTELNKEAIVNNNKEQEILLNNNKHIKR